MPSLKRKIARVQVKMRRRQQAKEEKKIEQLQKQRNKALKGANRLIAIAKAKEDAKDAKLQKSQAKARLNKTKSQSGKKMLQSLTRGSKVLLKDLRGRYEREAAAGRQERKATKRKSTKKR